jgi:hypothetical protein
MGYEGGFYNIGLTGPSSYNLGLTGTSLMVTVTPYDTYNRDRRRLPSRR